MSDVEQIALLTGEEVQAKDISTDNKTLSRNYLGTLIGHTARAGIQASQIIAASKSLTLPSASKTNENNKEI